MLDSSIPVNPGWVDLCRILACCLSDAAALSEVGSVPCPGTGDAEGPTGQHRWGPDPGKAGKNPLLAFGSQDLVSDQAGLLKAEVTCHGCGKWGCFKRRGGISASLM